MWRKFSVIVLVSMKAEASRVKRSRTPLTCLFYTSVSKGLTLLHLGNVELNVHRISCSLTA